MPGDRSNLEAAGPASLVVAAQRGDTLAMAALLTHLAGYVGRICGPIALDDGPDAAQETLITVMKALTQLADPDALFGWVRTIAVREAVRHARHRSNQPSPDIDLACLPSAGDPELRTDIAAVLDRLSPEHRAVLVLRDLHGFDEAEAAAMLTIAGGTVKSRLHRARRHFKEEWNK